MPVILAMLGVWYNNFFGAQTHGLSRVWPGEPFHSFVFVAASSEQLLNSNMKHHLLCFPALVTKLHSKFLVFSASVIRFLISWRVQNFTTLWVQVNKGKATWPGISQWKPLFSFTQQSDNNLTSRLSAWMRSIPKAQFFPIASQWWWWIFFLPCWVVVVIQYFSHLTVVFGKGCVWYEELRKVKKVLSSDAVRRSGWHPPRSVYLCVYLHLALKRITFSDSLPQHTVLQFYSETENQ